MLKPDVLGSAGISLIQGPYNDCIYAFNDRERKGWTRWGKYVSQIVF